MEEDKDDFVIEDDPDLTSQRDKEKKLRDKVKQAEEKAKEYLLGWQKSQADFINLRKRDEEDKREFSKFANKTFIEELIPVLDSFNIALSEGHKDLEPIYNQFLTIVKRYGLEEINDLGETFDPRRHESIGVEEVNDKEDDHKVLFVFQKGYTLAGRVLRPAKVRIGEFINN
ncbi:MAG: nucleotide exchange factor GrpE [Parcubacteria group bacterium]